MSDSTSLIISVLWVGKNMESRYSREGGGIEREGEVDLASHDDLRVG